MQLLEYLWWSLGCCYAVARVLRLVARVPGMVARVLLGMHTDVWNISEVF